MLFHVWEMMPSLEPWNRGWPKQFGFRGNNECMIVIPGVTTDVMFQRAEPSCHYQARLEKGCPVRVVRRNSLCEAWKGIFCLSADANLEISIAFLEEGRLCLSADRWLAKRMTGLKDCHRLEIKKILSAGMMKLYIVMPGLKCWVQSKYQASKGKFVWVEISGFQKKHQADQAKEGQSCLITKVSVRLDWHQASKGLSSWRG